MEVKTQNTITILNAFLCFCVIVIHILSEYMGKLLTGGWLYNITFVLNAMLSFSVPGFLFLSGMKLFGKYGGKPMKVGAFYKGRLTKVYVPYLIAAVVYFLYFYLRGWTALWNFPESVLLGTISAQLYYVVVAMQLYLLFPLLKLALEKKSVLTLLGALAVDVVFHEWIAFPHSDRFFGAYIFYFVLGMYVAQHKSEDRIKRCAWGFFCGAVLFGSVYIYGLYRYLTGLTPKPVHETLYVFYVTFAVLFLYRTSMWINEKKILRFAKMIGKGSYEIYLYHCLLLSVLRYDVFVNFPLSASAQYALTTVIVCGAAVLYCAIRDKLLK